MRLDKREQIVELDTTVFRPVSCQGFVFGDFLRALVKDFMIDQIVDVFTGHQIFMMP